MTNELAWSDFVRAVLKDDDLAPKGLLAAGHPIYYRERDTPDDLVIRESPDGRRELIRVTDTGAEFVVSVLQ